MKLYRQFFSVVVAVLFLIPSITVFASPTNKQKPVKVIKPNKTVIDAKSAAIDTEKFQLGFFLGSVAIEDFSNSFLYGTSFTYHITPRYITQLSYAQSDADRATFEDVTSGDFLSDDDEIFSYGQITLGFNVFPGRSFLGKHYKFNSDIYILAGVSQFQFAGEDKFGSMIGASYRVVLTDWMTWNVDFKDHIYQRDFLQEKKLTQNIEISTGFNILF